MRDTESETTSGEGEPVGERWQRASAGFLRSLLALPELALVAEPTRAVEAGELAAFADDDARENYATFFAFRDAVERAGTLEAHYLALVRGARTDRSLRR